MFGEGGGGVLHVSKKLVIQVTHTHGHISRGRIRPTTMKVAKQSIYHLYFSVLFCFCNVHYCIVGAPQNKNNAGSILTMAADDLIQPSASWLLDRSKQSGSWGVDTPRALLALLRVSADRSAATTTVNWDANSVQGLILRQEFDIQLLLFLLRFVFLLHN